MALSRGLISPQIYARSAGTANDTCGPAAPSFIRLPSVWGSRLSLAGHLSQRSAKCSRCATPGANRYEWTTPSWSPLSGKSRTPLDQVVGGYSSRARVLRSVRKFGIPSAR